jgi:hypothetical protein
LRVLVGVIFVLAAAETRFPTFIWVLGIVTILAGLALPIIGAERIQWMGRWGLRRSDSMVRLWGAVAGAFGAFVAWAAW